ncbi:hypothetical protein AB0F42_03555 [Streptomyces buecherae]|uniref:hypothetical protein n=1 Tax=Streptomyces buecherae TaxID=2763006 RepID=UPI0033D3993D
MTVKVTPATGASGCMSAGIRISGTTLVSTSPRSAAAAVRSNAKRTPADWTSMRWAMAASDLKPMPPGGLAEESGRLPVFAYEGVA